jgi:hypothetical protein
MHRVDTEKSRLALRVGLAPFGDRDRAGRVDSKHRRSEANQIRSKEVEDGELMIPSWNETASGEHTGTCKLGYRRGNGDF